MISTGQKARAGSNGKPPKPQKWNLIRVARRLVGWSHIKDHPTPREKEDRPPSEGLFFMPESRDRRGVQG